METVYTGTFSDVNSVTLTPPIHCKGVVKRVSCTIISWPWCNFLMSSVPWPEITVTLQWRQNGLDGVSNHQTAMVYSSVYSGADQFIQPFIQAQVKETSTLHVTGLCGGSSPVTDEFPPQMASNAENASIWWRHHADSFLSMATYNILWLQFFPEFRIEQNSCVGCRKQTVSEGYPTPTPLNSWYFTSVNGLKRKTISHVSL